jgi:hypothetical protein
MPILNKSKTLTRARALRRKIGGDVPSPQTPRQTLERDGGSSLAAESRRGVWGGRHVPPSLTLPCPPMPLRHQSTTLIPFRRMTLRNARAAPVGCFVARFSYETQPVVRFSHRANGEIYLVPAEPFAEHRTPALRSNKA